MSVAMATELDPIGADCRERMLPLPPSGVPLTRFMQIVCKLYANCMQIVCKLYANETQPACLMTPVTICICLQSFITGRISITEHLVFLQESHWESLDGNMQMSQRHSAVEAFHQNKPRVDSENLQKPLGGREGGEFQESEPSPWRILQQQPEKERNGREICKLGRGKALKRANGKNIQVHLGPINPNQSQSIPINPNQSKLLTYEIWTLKRTFTATVSDSHFGLSDMDSTRFRPISFHFLAMSDSSCHWAALPEWRLHSHLHFPWTQLSKWNAKWRKNELWRDNSELRFSVFTSPILCDVHSAPFRPIQLVNLFKYSPE